ncbi:putidacin L1 family lectin-like bacteriocin [uncultured Pseudomonas sp.]|uniref:putidacin L1 family lectin-like bacteriocin n=1 Tax=uncultured Pseudomonas sp. TaxID=114707 RepID=UPI00258AC944|nr:putidacin L1 family lectin-like bacteriocin [uncultured Pseudomonas sp.]
MTSFAQTSPFTASGTAILPPLTKMSIGQNLTSPSGRFKLELQSDSNLAIYDNGTAVWVATSGQPYTSYSTAVEKGSTFLITQYYAFLNDPTRNRTWGTSNSTPLGGNVSAAYYRTYMVLQDDGNLVITDTVPLWSSNNSSTAFSLSKSNLRIEPGTFLEPGKLYESGANRLVFQGDGNLVVYGPNSQVLWASYTHNKGADQAVMQGDGNFVIYAKGKPIWYTNTDGNPGAYAQVKEDGSFCIVIDRPVWARFGFTPDIKPKRVLVEYGPYKLPSWSFDIWR